MTDDPNAGADGYAGQLGIGDDSSTFGVMMFIAQSILGRVRTCVLVKVMAIEAAGELAPVGTLDAMPLVNQVDGIGNSTPHATIFNLPYFRLQGGANAVIIDPKVGDVGIAVIADRDSSAVKSTKAQANPGSKRRFDLADGMYFGGFLNGMPDQYVRFTDDGIKVADKNGNVLEMKVGGTFVTGNLVVDGNLQLSGAFEAVDGGTYDGALRVTGDVVAKSGTASSVGLATHKHTQPNDGHNDVEQPTAAPTGGT